MLAVKTAELRPHLWLPLLLACFIDTPVPHRTDQSRTRIPIYDAQELSRREPLYRSFVQPLFREDLIGQLPLQERATMSDVTLLLPGGVLESPPIAIGANVSERTIYFPIQTIAFIDDLATLAAWLAKQNCSFEPSALYASMLVTHAPPAGGGFHPNPRAAFGLSDNVWNDSFIKNSSNQILKTAVYFSLAHELGHIRHRHPPYDSVTSAQAQEQELEADRYAIEAMRHIGVPPVGMFQLFVVLSRMEGSVPVTHPLSGARLLQIAAAMEQSPGDFVPANESVTRWAPIIGQYARQFRTLIPVVDNRDLREQFRQQSRVTTWAELRNGCPG